MDQLDKSLPLSMTECFAALPRCNFFVTPGPYPQFRYDRPLKASTHNKESRSPKVALSCAIHTALLSSGSRFVCCL